MTATQMFRGLGYILTGNNSEKLIYWKDKCEDSERAKFIIFKKNYKKVLPVLSGKEDYSFSLSVEELKAINKQIEELGWLDEIDISKIPTIGHIDSDGHIILPKNEKW